MKTGSSIILVFQQIFGYDFQFIINPHHIVRQQSL